MTMALEHFTILLLSLVFSFRVCQASNVSFALPFLKGEPYIPSAPGTPDEGEFPFEDSIVSDLRLNHDTGHKKLNKNNDDFTISTISSASETSGDVSNVATVNLGIGFQDAESKKTKIVEGRINNSLEKQNADLSRQFSSMNFPSLEAALLSLAFLTFAVFVINLLQDLLRGSSSGRKRRSSEPDDRMTDVIVLALSSIDTLSYGTQNPICGQKLLCHLNRSGWHDGLLGSASNYIVSLLLSVFSPKSNFQNNLDAAHFGRENEECTEKYSGCPSVLGELLPQ
ncbi:uncharacterized protein [Palaemon carinicauda]|uniref:uncharacterized protein n=1 Tax=Palaemon carinicauda TaxID=392227 RepID=UPI0035B580AC